MTNTRKILYHLISLAVCVMLGDLMYISDILMEFLPNIHIVAVLIVVTTVAYRSYALISIYVYVFLNGLFSGFGPWWVAYLYIWTILWGAVMLVPRGFSKTLRRIIYIALCALHGFAFGLLYLPVQAAFFSSDPTYLKAWWSIGFVTADLYHGIGNLIFGILLIVPLSELMIKLESKMRV